MGSAVPVPAGVSVAVPVEVSVGAEVEVIGGSCVGVGLGTGVLVTMLAGVLARHREPAHDASRTRVQPKHVPETGAAQDCLGDCADPVH